VISNIVRKTVTQFSVRISFQKESKQLERLFVLKQDDQDLPYRSALTFSQAGMQTHISHKQMNLCIAEAMSMSQIDADTTPAGVPVAIILLAQKVIGHGFNKLCKL
jgi:hypothetical protein